LRWGDDRLAGCLTHQWIILGSFTSVMLRSALNGAHHHRKTWYPMGDARCLTHQWIILGSFTSVILRIHYCDQPSMEHTTTETHDIRCMYYRDSRPRSNRVRRIQYDTMKAKSGRDCFFWKGMKLFPSNRYLFQHLVVVGLRTGGGSRDNPSWRIARWGIISRRLLCWPPLAVSDNFTPSRRWREVWGRRNVVGFDNEHI
jgi:hypothetical protein